MTSFSLPPTKGRTVAVLGGGVLGRRIACGWAAGGHDVVVRDPNPEQRIAALHYCQANMAQFAQFSQSTKKRGAVSAEEDLAAAVGKAWLVIEAVPEQLALKTETLAQLERLAPADALLCSNSSSFKSREMLGDLRLETKRRVLNMHYYMPPGNRVVELMTDGLTHDVIFPHLVEELRAIGFHPFVARKESTGLIFNRLWAAIKREVLTILAEGVSTPEEIEALWKEMWLGNHHHSGPVAMMDSVGLDTVSLIEQHYIAERGLPDTPVRFLQGYLDQGRLGAKSSKGGLLPPGFTSKTGDHDSVHAPLLYFLDAGLAAANDKPEDALRAGRILIGSPDQRALKTLMAGQVTPDGIDISLDAGKMFWTSMGTPSENDGAVFSASLAGGEPAEIVARGRVHTPKQIAVDHRNSKLYFSDREGLRVMRCNLDGSALEPVVVTGDWRRESDAADQTNWCVGIAVSPATGKFYWTQKGPPKGSQGRIFRANMDFLPGEDAASRTDVDLLLQNLPEPIDLDIDPVDETLYWTDRGELPLGNSINRAKLSALKPRPQGSSSSTSLPGRDYELIVRNLHEAIGIRIDQKNRHVYATDLGGAVYRFDMDGRNRRRLYEEAGALTGIALSYVRFD